MISNNFEINSNPTKSDKSRNEPNRTTLNWGPKVLLKSCLYGLNCYSAFYYPIYWDAAK